MKNKYLSLLTELTYKIIPNAYSLQLNFFNGNHFEVLKKKLKDIPFDYILEIGCGTAPILNEFQFKNYVGIDIEKKFINICKNKNKNKNYTFLHTDLDHFKSDKKFDAVILSHTTHHFSDAYMKKFIELLKKINFKYLIIYDGKPIGLLAPVLTKLDLGANFRELEEFYSFFQKTFKLLHSEVFRSNRPFYKYPLLIYKKL